MPKPTPGEPRESRPAPKDHLPTAEALRAEAVDEQPAGAELLVPVHKLRVRQRNKILRVAAQFAEHAAPKDDTAETDTPHEGAAESPTSLAHAAAGLDMLDAIDELLETEFAVDPAWYAAWATVEGGGPDLEGRIVDLFSWYAGALGE